MRPVLRWCCPMIGAVGMAVALLAAAEGFAQQVTGVLGSPSATTAIDGKQIGKMDDVLIWLERYGSPDQTVQVSVLRADGKPATIPVKLAARPQQKTN